MCPDSPVKPNDLVARFIGSRPHVRVRLSIVGKPRQGLLKGAPEALTEVACLDARDMLNQSQKVGPGGSQRSADVVLGEPVELPQEDVSSNLQVPAQFCFRIRCDHMSRMPQGSRQAARTGREDQVAAGPDSRARACG